MAGQSVRVQFCRVGGSIIERFDLVFQVCSCSNALIRWLWPWERFFVLDCSTVEKNTTGMYLDVSNMCNNNVSFVVCQEGWL